jgi:hypothetical protein
MELIRYYVLEPLSPNVANYIVHPLWPLDLGQDHSEYTRCPLLCKQNKAWNFTFPKASGLK